MLAASMSTAQQTPATPYELLGGESGLRRLVDRFYDIMEQEPSVAALRAMHAPDLTPMRERLFDYLSGWLGGPPLYFQRPDAKCMVSAHQPFAIRQAESGQWMYCMERALEDIAITPEFRHLLVTALRRMATAFRSH
jgi:hemoglobin